MSDSYEAIEDISNRDIKGYKILKATLLALLVLMLASLSVSAATTSSDEGIGDDLISAETTSK